MKKSEMTNYMRQEMWVDRVEQTIAGWENLQGKNVSDDIREDVIKFMRKKIKKGIKRGTLTRVFMQIAVTVVLHLKTKGDK